VAKKKKAKREDSTRIQYKKKRSFEWVKALKPEVHKGETKTRHPYQDQMKGELKSETTPKFRILRKEEYRCT